MIMRSLKAARLSHLTFATLLASGSLAFAGGCSSEDDGPSEDVEDLQPADDDDDDEPAVPSPSDNVTPPPPPPAPGSPGANGLELPDDFLDWRVIGAAQPNGGMNPSIRVILGNDIAVEAARSGETNPWPEGTQIGHIVWTQGDNEDATDIVAPGNFGAFTLMSKDSDEYAADGGWAYGRWVGENLTPLAEGQDRDCVDCHTRLVSDKDYVFTQPGALPTLDAVNSAAPAPNGLKIPTNILDWRVIGIASVPNADPTQSTLRVVVGNSVAVAAARAGETNPWPENAAIAHFQWIAGENPDSADTIVPANFARLTFMVRSEDLFAADGDWAFSVWQTPELTAPEAEGFDSDCIGCHANLVGDNDRVFTRPGALPEAYFDR